MYVRLDYSETARIVKDRKGLRAAAWEFRNANGVRVELPSGTKLYYLTGADFVADSYDLANKLGLS